MTIIFGHSYSTSYPVRSPTTPRAPRGGWCGDLAGFHQNIQRRNRSVFYPTDFSGFSMFISTAPTSLFSGASQRMNHHARTVRGSFILNATVAGKAP
jgi:hypothetical protein